MQQPSIVRPVGEQQRQMQHMFPNPTQKLAQYSTVQYKSGTKTPPSTSLPANYEAHGRLKRTHPPTLSAPPPDPPPPPPESYTAASWSCLSAAAELLPTTRRCCRCCCRCSCCCSGPQAFIAAAAAAAADDDDGGGGGPLPPPDDASPLLPLGPTRLKAAKEPPRDSAPQAAATGAEVWRGV
jgi:hypothetical protein